MCGIAGFIDTNNQNKSSVEDRITQMMSAILHRGPDDQRALITANSALGFVRLSIVDLDGGAQPWVENGVAIAFNGEIFNYLDLRKTLITKGVFFHTNSEIETLYHLYKIYGSQMVEMLNGQFAIVVHDKRDSSLHLFRDPMGIRPMFWTVDNGTIYYASEIKSLHAGLGKALSLSNSGLFQTMNSWALTGDQTAFEGVFQVPPGCRVTFSGLMPRIERYWSWPIPSCQPILKLKNDEEYFEAFREQFSRAVLRQSMSDVEVASYLSGGVDSSVMAYNLSEQLKSRHRKLNTFSVVFDDPGYDESLAQSEVTQLLMTNHASRLVTRNDIADNFWDVVRYAEAPLFRTAPVPMYLLSKKVQQAGIKVVMTGEGADEILFGYDIFREAKIRRFWARNPNSRMRKELFKRLYSYLPQYKNDRYFNLLLDFYRSTLNVQNDQHYGMLVRWANGGALINGLSYEARQQAMNYASIAHLENWLPENYLSGNDIERTQMIENATLLSNYLLSSQGDRMTMAHSVEGRYPYLDLEFIKFASTLPERLKLRGLKDKFILRESYKEKLPNSIARRPKVAYQAPEMTSFFNSKTGKPVDYVEELLSHSSVSQRGLFDPAYLQILLKKGGVGQNARMGFRENMFFILALSTSILEKIYCAVPEIYPINLNLKVIRSYE